uniref:Uncharacterized protein n=1 Tax=Marseillevirus LCMAC102 TaxID=2506603 RepID=A0A481YTC3_9VIRU|nr:MAG: hypothetical protein LCMAC102_00450 [Marseillevirus LCMAC102]
MNEQRRKILQRRNAFNKKYIEPNLKRDVLNVGEIFKTYRGIKHLNNLMPEYNYTYEPTEVQNRWEKKKSGIINHCHCHDIVHQIRTPIDTKFTMTGNFSTVFEKNLKKDEPFMLNLPLYALHHRHCLVEFLFDPPTDYEQTFIDIEQTWCANKLNLDLVADYAGHILVVPDNGFFTSNGVLARLDN